MSVYYNEFDPFAAAWLRKLIERGELPKGHVDETPIQEVKAESLKAYSQCHFFAGIGIWPYVLNRSGWGNRPVWTGSCPCQPFSSPGQHRGISDSRHLWPTWHRLISKLRPDTIFGEQVAGKNGLAWLDIVSTDLEASNYAIGAACTNACSFGAPHRRHRLYFVATLGYANGGRQMEQESGARRKVRNTGKASQVMANPSVQRLERTELQGKNNIGKKSSNGSMGYTLEKSERTIAQCSHSESPWQPFERLETRDEKEERPIEPGLLPLAYGTPTSVGRLRGFGNGLCAPQAQGFIESFLEICQNG